MSSLFFWSAICITCPIIYAALGGEVKNGGTNDKYKKYEEDTYKYFRSLPLDYQEKYYRENLDLKYYKDDLRLGLTDDRERNAKHAAEISRLLGKPFIDYNKTY